MKRRGDAPVAFDPINGAVTSGTPRLLETISVCTGSRPESMVEWPGAVSVMPWSCHACGKNADCVSESPESARELRPESIEVVTAKLIDGDEHDERRPIRGSTGLCADHRWQTGRDRGGKDTREFHGRKRMAGRARTQGTARHDSVTTLVPYHT